MPLAKNLIEAAGNATQANYIEDVFSPWLIKPSADYTTYSINNGIDLSTKGGMTWFKARDAAQNNLVYDTSRGSSSGSPNALITNGTQAQQTAYFDYVTPNTNGFTVNFASGGGQLTNGGINYASWTFRKQPKFFTCGTFTGDGTTNKVITHDLNGTTGFIIVKRTDSTGNWPCWHRTFTAKQTIFLNTTDAKQTYSGADDITVTDNSFTVGTNQIFGNGSGFTYVYYVFAHNAGGFGLTGTDNVISCGSFTTDGSGAATVNLGYEPQWILVKRNVSGGNWYLLDTMRGWVVDPSGGANDKDLYANLYNAEAADNLGNPTATGFYFKEYASAPYIYIAIRKGPMKVPTDATKVFSPNVSAASQGTKITTNFPVDMQWSFYRAGGFSVRVDDRLRGVNTTTTSGTISTPYLQTASTSAETSYTGDTLGWDNTGFQMPNGWAGNAMSFNNFQRAPSFFDEVCYTGTGTFTTPFTHNLTVTPELVIVKARTTTGQMNWYVGQYGVNKYGQLTTAAFNPDLSTYAPVTSTTFVPLLDNSGINYVAYLFATCAGVSKVGSYTGTGTTQQVDCGFAAGARFVLIKRTDFAGDWYVWDTARGIVTGNDPYLLLNSTTAEVTITDYIDPYSAGFELSTTAAATVNVIGGSYIFLAIA